MVRLSESRFPSSDGKSQIYFREYLPAGEAKAIVQIVHGIAEHIVRYDPFARFLAENGYIVVGGDHLGHGRSARSEADLGCWSDRCWEKVVQDIHSLHDATAAKFPGKPYFLFGHSMGSFLVRTYMIRYRTGLDGVVLSGTGQQGKALLAGGRLMCRAEIRKHGRDFRSPLLNKLAFGKYNDGFEYVRTASDWISRDEAVVDAYQADPLCGYVPSAGLFQDMLDGLDFVTNRKNVARMKKDLPVYFMSGDRDPVGENGRGVIRAYKSFLRAGMTDVTMKLYHEGRHEMLNELNRDEVYRDVLAWFNSKTGL